MAPVVCMPSAASLPVSSSAYGTLQPPCLNPPRRSSSGRPGACMTPSRVTLLNTTIFVIEDLLRSLAHRDRAPRALARELLVADPVRLVGRGPELAVAELLVLGEVALEPAHDAVAFEGED